MKRKKIAFAFYYLNNNVYIRTLKLKKNQVVPIKNLSWRSYPNGYE